MLLTFGLSFYFLNPLFHIESHHMNKKERVRYDGFVFLMNSLRHSSSHLGATIVEFVDARG